MASGSFRSTFGLTSSASRAPRNSIRSFSGSGAVSGSAVGSVSASAPRAIAQAPRCCLRPQAPRPSRACAALGSPRSHCRYRLAYPGLPGDLQHFPGGAEQPYPRAYCPCRPCRCEAPRGRRAARAPPRKHAARWRTARLHRDHSATQPRRRDGTMRRLAWPGGILADTPSGTTNTTCSRRRPSDASDEGVPLQGRQVAVREHDALG